MRRLGTAILFFLLAGCEPCASGLGHGKAHQPPSPVRVRPFKCKKPDVVLLVTGGTTGMLEVCNCAGPMPGGLARRSGLVRSYRAAYENTFLLDSGDLFWVDPDDVRNDFILKGYRQVGYDAVVLGDQEWAVAAKKFSRMLAACPMKYLSTTVAPADPSIRLPMERLVTRTWPGVKLAVVSCIRQEQFLFFDAKKLAGLSFSPRPELVRRIEELKAGGFLVVVVVHGDFGCVEAAAKTLDADLIIQGHTSRTDSRLRLVAGKPVVKVGGADTVGAVAMRLSPAGDIVEIEYRAELVDRRWPIDWRLIQTYQAYAHAAMRKALGAKRKEGLDYVPSVECGRCHNAQYDAWLTGPHARAYRTLQKAGRSGDPNCLMCHTSGFGTAGGFYTFEKTPKLAGVNCQNCHRFNVPEHQQAGFRLPRADENVCTTCHTPVTDPKFKSRFKHRMNKIRCPHK